MSPLVALNERAFTPVKVKRPETSRHGAATPEMEGAADPAGARTLNAAELERESITDEAQYDRREIWDRG